MVGWRCVHVVKHKQSSNHFPAVCWIVEGCEHMQLDFYALIEESYIYKC